MEYFKHYNLTIIFVFCILFSHAQSSLLNGQFNITDAGMPQINAGSTYFIAGNFSDPLSVFSADSIKVGDIIADYYGKMYKIDLITAHIPYSDKIVADVTYLGNSEFSFPAGGMMGCLFRPTRNGYALATVDATNLGLQIALQNSATIGIDSDISSYQSGSIMPATAKLGDGFYNTTEKKLYIYNGTTWVPIGSGVVPTGGSSEFPNPAKAGEMFFNTDNNSSYIYNGTLWLKISTNGSTPAGIFNPDPATADVNEGDLFYNTSDHKLYVYNGTIWMPADNILPNGQIYVGNATNVATAVAMTGDASINNNGKLTIVNGAVTDDKLDKLHIPLSGFANPTDNVSLGDGTTNNRIINLANPTALQDAATKNYVDVLFSNPSALLNLPSGNFFIGNISNKAVATTKNAIPLSGFGSATASISLGDGTTNNRIINLANPSAAQDAATKNYVDTKSVALSNIALPTGNLILGDATGKAAAVTKNTILLSGFGAAGADISLGGFKITNLLDPSTAQDAATKNYVDSKSVSLTNITLPTGNLLLGDATGKAAAVTKNTILLSGFGAADTDISLGGFKVTNLADPITAQDAATKKYIDDLFLTPGSSLSLASGKLFLGNTSGKAVATSPSAISVSEFGKANATINMGDVAKQYNISFLAEPLYPQDAATKNYVDSKISAPGALTLSEGFIFVGNSSNLAAEVTKDNVPISDFGIATKAISMGNGTVNFKITNLADPAGDLDAANKKYVDAKIASTMSGGTLPPGGQVGDTYYLTSDNQLYTFTGASWVIIGNDNLGNHRATQNLKMAAFGISNSGTAGKGLGFDASDNATFGQNVTVNGNFYTPSDQRLKTNIATLSEVLQAIDQIRGVRFEYKDQKKYAAGPKIGVIAQELQKVFPELVCKGKDGFLKVDYSQLTGVLIQAIKEQQQQIKQQQLEITNLTNRMESQQKQIDTILKKL